MVPEPLEPDGWQYYQATDDHEFLYAYPFGPADIPRNVDCYLARTSHGSTLSGGAHSWVLARSDRPRSWRHFQRALDSDIADVQGGTTPEGIHVGAHGRHHRSRATLLYRHRDESQAAREATG